MDRTPLGTLEGATMAGPHKQHRVVIVGAGFAGFNAARELFRVAGASIENVVINSTDYFLYLPLMPQVAGGWLEPRHVLVSLPGVLRKMFSLLVTDKYKNIEQKEVHWAA